MSPTTFNAHINGHASNSRMIATSSIGRTTGASIKIATVLRINLVSI